MTQRKLKKQLRQYAAECKMLIPKEKEKQIVSLLQAESRDRKSTRLNSSH